MIVQMKQSSALVNEQFRVSDACGRGEERKPPNGVCLAQVGDAGVREMLQGQANRAQIMEP